MAGEEPENEGLDHPLLFQTGTTDVGAVASRGVNSTQCLNRTADRSRPAHAFIGRNCVLCFERCAAEALVGRQRIARAECQSEEIQTSMRN